LLSAQRYYAREAAKRLRGAAHAPKGVGRSNDDLCWSSSLDFRGLRRKTCLFKTYLILVAEYAPLSVNGSPTPLIDDKDAVRFVRTFPA
jgi:hypothetical protein